MTGVFLRPAIARRGASNVLSSFQFATQQRSSVVWKAVAATQIRTKVSDATAVWKGTLKEGAGACSSGSGIIQNLPYTFPSRFEADSTKTNPEEMIGGAFASCYSMFVSALLTKMGLTPDSVTTVASVDLGEGPEIKKIQLKCECKCTGIENERFQEIAKEAKAGCPISKALSSVPEIQLEAKLL